MPLYHNQEVVMEKFRRGSITIKKGAETDLATMKDSSVAEYVKFRSEVRDKLKKLTDDIKSIKMQLGRTTATKKTKKSDINILERGE